MDLDEAAQSIAEHLGQPVLVFDDTLRVVSFSVHEGDVDPGRLATILSRKATPLAMEMIAESQVNTGTDAVFLPAVRHVTPRILMPLRHDGMLQGYLSVSVPSDSNPGLFENYLDEVATMTENIAAMLALRNFTDRDRSTLKQELFVRLFSSDAEERALASSEILNLGFVANSHQYFLIALQTRHIGKSDAPSIQLDIEGAIRSITRFTRFTALGGEIDGFGVVVVPEDIPREQLELLLEQHWRAKLIAGVSSAQAHIHDLPDALRESLLALKSAQRRGFDSEVGNWNEMGLDRLLLQLPLSDIKWTDLPEPVQKLLEPQSGIDLIRTIDQYLTSGGEAQETAKRLNIHRSTLYYRLDKVRELTGVDLADGTVRRELHTGLRIAELAGFWKP